VRQHAVDLPSCRPQFLHRLPDLRRPQTLRCQILRRVAFDFGRMVDAPLDLIPQLPQFPPPAGSWYTAVAIDWILKSSYGCSDRACPVRSSVMLNKPHDRAGAAPGTDNCFPSSRSISGRAERLNAGTRERRRGIRRGGGHGGQQQRPSLICSEPSGRALARPCQRVRAPPCLLNLQGLCVCIPSTVDLRGA
jgi:hypothetical protein